MVGTVVSKVGGDFVGLTKLMVTFSALVVVGLEVVAVVAVLA